MATGAGYKSKAAFRLNKPNLNVDLTPVTNGAVDTAYPTTTTISDAGAQRMGPYDLIPFISESLGEVYEREEHKTLSGKAGITGLDIIKKTAKGTVDLQAMYLGLDNIFAAALGYEKPSYNDSPTFDESATAGNPMTGTTTSGTTGSTLEDTGASQFTDNIIGEWVRLADSGDAKEGQVRRISARASATSATVTPAWTTNPGAGITYQIARAFTHTYECSEHMGVEAINGVYTSYDTETSGNTTDPFLRFGTLVFDKTVGIWEYQGCMINSLTFKRTPKECTLSMEVIPFALQLSSAVNTASTTWAFSAQPTSPIHVVENINPADLVFRLGDYSASSALDSGDNLAISEFSLTINNNLDIDTQDTVSGLRIAEPIRAGFRDISGYIKIPRYTSNTNLTAFQADTIQMASAVFIGSTLTGDDITATNSLKFWLRSLKFIKPAEPIKGAGLIDEQFDFKCIVPAAAPAGMPTVNNANTEIVIQTTNNNPFNAFRGQNGE